MLTSASGVSECGCGSRTPMRKNIMWKGGVLVKNANYEVQNERQTAHNPLKQYDWYFKPPKNGLPPTCPPEVTSFIENYNVLYLGDTSKKYIYLTFDAGFDEGTHTIVLDKLKEHAVTAAFFVDGNFLRKNAHIAKRITDEGHLLCNHSLSHPDMSAYTTFEEYKKQILGWENLARELDLKFSKFYRPPRGRFTEQSLSFDKDLGYHTVMWTFAYYDWDKNKQPSKAKALKLIDERVSNGTVLLLHSTSARNTESLGEIIELLKGKGFEFKDLNYLVSQS